MRCLILAAGRFDDSLRAQISQDREPRLDIFELERALGADFIDFKEVDTSRNPAVKLAARTAGPSAAVALLGFLNRDRYDAFFTTGDKLVASFNSRSLGVVCNFSRGVAAQGETTTEQKIVNAARAETCFELFVLMGQSARSHFHRQWGECSRLNGH